MPALLADALRELGRATPEVLARLRVLAEELATPEGLRWVAWKALRRLER